MTSSRHDFDFVLGTWSVHNHKLTDPTDPSCTEWVEFGARSVVTPILDGGGHTDEMTVDEPTDGGDPFTGFTLRLHDPDADVWRIWWSSTRAPGVLDVPVVGRFQEGRGVFDAVDTIGGRRTRVRFEWQAGAEDRPQWEQSFSYDDGATWFVNWRMVFTRS